MTPLEVLAAHRLVRSLWDDGYACGSDAGCDWTLPDVGDAPVGPAREARIARARLAHAAHVLDALMKAGHAVVTLPDGERDGDGQVWFDDGAELRVDTTGHRLPHDVWDGRILRTPAGLRRSARSLLAAAAAAETGGKA